MFNGRRVESIPREQPGRMKKVSCGGGGGARAGSMLRRLELYLGGLALRSGEPVGAKTFVDGNRISGVQRCCPRTFRHLLPDLFVVQMHDNVVRKVIDTDDTAGKMRGRGSRFDGRPRRWGRRRLGRSAGAAG